MKFGTYISEYKLNDSIKVVNKYTHIETEYDYYIARPSILGNPYSHNKNSIAKYYVESRNIAIDKYKNYFYEKINTDNEFKNEINKLIKIYKENKKINLVCWCKPKKCHGDIIKEYIIKKIKDG